jgi:hypothetical protein
MVSDDVNSSKRMERTVTQYKHLNVKHKGWRCRFRLRQMTKWYSNKMLLIEQHHAGASSNYNKTCVLTPHSWNIMQLFFPLRQHIEHTEQGLF